MLRRCLWRSCQAAAGSLSRPELSCCEQSSAGILFTKFVLSPSALFFGLRSCTSDSVSRGTGVDSEHSGGESSTDDEQSDTVQMTRSPLSDIFPSDSDDDDPMTEEMLATDEFLDRWQDLLEKDDFAGIHGLIRSKFDPSAMPTFEELLKVPDRGEEEKAARREYELRLQEEVSRQRVRMLDAFGRVYATGKRKTSVARVWLWRGMGNVSINKRAFEHYFQDFTKRADVLSPFRVTGTLGEFDVMATVKGGGTSGQSQAIRHGISKALQIWDPQLRPVLKAGGFLTRDSRVVERKKPGRKKARKAFQWVKR